MTIHPKQHSLVVLFSLICVLPSQAVTKSSLSSPETISGQLSTARGFNWKYRYDIKQTDTSVLLTVNINLIPSHGVSTIELQNARKIWKEGIEKFWGNQFELLIAGEKKIPVLVKVFFHGPVFHHHVIVRPGKGFSDELNWHLRNTAELTAHEFGHMIGVYDEYERGALDPDNPVIDKSSIMTSSPTQGTTYPRHYRRIVEWFKSHNHIDDVQLVPVSPPNR